MSGKKDKSGSRAKSTATVPDIDLWERYTRTIQPVQRQDQPVPPVEKPSRENFGALLDGKATRTEPKKPSQPEHTPLHPLTQREVKRPAKTEPNAKAAPAPSNVDPHLLRRTKRGGGFDARIDLHGMRRGRGLSCPIGLSGRLSPQAAQARARHYRQGHEFKASPRLVGHARARCPQEAGAAMALTARFWTPCLRLWSSWTR